MRAAVLLLLLVNLMLFAHGQGYLGGQESGREPMRLKRQLDADKLRIVSGDPSPRTTSPPEVAAPDCKRIDDVTAMTVEAIKRNIAEMPGWEIGVTPMRQAPAHWVVIPELPTRAAAGKKQVELRQLGVNEGHIVEDATSGPFAVSLGIFRNPEGAEELLQTVARKGVRSARLARRELPPEKFSIELRAATTELSRKLPDLLNLAPNANLVSDCTGK